MRDIRKSVKEGNYSVREISEEAGKKEDIVRFDIGQPSFDTPENVKKAAREVINEEKITYTSLWGIEDLRQEAADFESHKAKYNKENVMITTGGIGALYCVFSTLCNSGDNIVFSDPCWPVYSLISKSSTSELRQVPFIKDGEINAEAIRSKIDNRTKAIVINSPENPTGRIYSREEIDELAEIARENDLWIIGDEVYDRLTYGREHVSVAEVAPKRSLIINSMSKNFAMTGWRIGWVATKSKELIHELGKLNRSTTACPNFVGQYAALEGLKNSKDYIEIMRQTYSERKKLIQEELDDIGIKYVNPEGAIYIFPDVERDSWKFSKELLDHAGVSVVPGEPSGRDSRNNVRICFGTVSKKEIKEGMRRMREFMD